MMLDLSKNFSLTDSSTCLSSALLQSSERESSQSHHKGRVFASIVVSVVMDHKTIGSPTSFQAIQMFFASGTVGLL